MTKEYICYIKREDRMEEPKTITVTDTELIAIIEEGREVQGYRMEQIEMITTKDDTNYYMYILRITRTNRIQ